MPQAIIPILAVIGITGTAAVIAAEVISTILISLVITKITSLFVGKPGAAPPPPINVTVQSTAEYRRIVFGQIRCGGVVGFYRCGGSTNQYLFYLVMYAGHQCGAALDAFLDARQVPSADIDNTTGAVATAVFNGKLQIWTHLGTEGQAVDAQLNSFFPSLFDTNHKLKGICYRVFKMTRDDTAWPNGVPQALNSVVQGALLYDPRKDSTNGGSGSHLRTDPTTWEYSDNAALAVRWYLSGGTVANDNPVRNLKYGLKETDSRINDAYIIAAANHSDETLSGANAPPSGSQKRYVVGIEQTAGQTRRDILTELLSTLGVGQLSYVHGSWRLYAGAYDAPSYSFTQDDLYGEMEIQDTTSATDRYNTVCGTYVDAAQLYQAATTIYRTNSAYVAQDNGETIQKSLPLRGVTDNYRAQRIVEQAMRASRLMRTVNFRFRRGAMRIATWETFSFSHKRYGWVNRTFRCIQRQLEYQQDGGILVIITGKFEDPGAYTDLLTADYTTGTSVTSAIQAELPDQPLSLTATSIGGQNIRLDWTLPSFWLQNGVSQILEGTAISPSSAAAAVWEGRGTSVVLTRNDTTTRYYWVRVKTVGGQVGAVYPTGNGVAGAAGQVATGDIEDDATSQTVVAVVPGTGHTTVPISGVTQNVDMVSVSITTTGGTTGIDCTTNFSLSGTNFSSPTNCLLTVQRDGSDVGTAQFDAKQAYDAYGLAIWQGQVTLTVLDTPSAGAHTYAFHMIANATGTSLNVATNYGAPTIKVREYKGK